MRFWKTVWQYVFTIICIVLLAMCMTATVVTFMVSDYTLSGVFLLSSVLSALMAAYAFEERL